MNNKCASSLAFITEDELRKISRYIYQRTGIVITPEKKEMVFNRLSKRLRELKITDFSGYIRYLEQNLAGQEWQYFTNALTTNLTAFFREAYHFPMLAEHARHRRRNYTVWSAATSTGEEACSIAMTLNGVPGLNAIGPCVWATDVDTDVLQKARRGIYRSEDLRNLTDAQKADWFVEGAGEHTGLVRVRQELLGMIHYQQLNLMDHEWNVPGPFDAIFCRNVMIYFDRETQLQLLRRFARMLKPGGLLFTGHAEHFNDSSIPFRLRGQSVYYLPQESS